MKAKKRAFSLVEMSIVILIVAILLAGGLVISVNALNNAAIKVSKQRMEIIYKAMGDYLITNKRLPCPAPITASKSQSSTYGDDTSTPGNCSVNGAYSSTSFTNLVYGMVPVKDLGLSNEMAQDGFGSKFSYIVHQHYTKATVSPYSDTDSFATSSAANLVVKEKNTVDQVIASDVVFVILSHGANKLGAFNANSTKQNNNPSDAEELLNVINVVTTNTADFTNEIYVLSQSSDDFDDIVFYKDRQSIVSDFKAFSTIPCQAISAIESDVSYSSTVMTWPAALYGQVVAANENCPLGYTGGATRPTKKCDISGTWQAGTINPCVQQRVTSVCTGGDMIYVSGLRIVHVFTNTASAGTFTCSEDITAELFVLAGGGGGGGGVNFSCHNDSPGGGGGGGEYVLTIDQIVTTEDSLTITVGGGGSAGTQNNQGGVGGDSIVSGLASDITAKGGNGGGKAGTCNPVPTVVNSGAPGGGSCGGTVANADKNGGTGYLDNTCGGGASQDNVGGNGLNTIGGYGGAGYTYLDDTTYGSGGGGGVSSAVNKSYIGLAGGVEAGNGAYGEIGKSAESAFSNRGGGGGGGGNGGSAGYNGGSGGSGIVIISYYY